MIRGEYKHLLGDRRDSIRRECEAKARGPDGVIRRIGGAIPITRGESAMAATRAVMQELGITDYIDMQSGYEGFLQTIIDSDVPEDWDLPQQARQRLMIQRAKQALMEYEETKAREG